MAAETDAHVGIDGAKASVAFDDFDAPEHSRTFDDFDVPEHSRTFDDPNAWRPTDPSDVTSMP